MATEEATIAALQNRVKYLEAHLHLQGNRTRF